MNKTIISPCAVEVVILSTDSSIAIHYMEVKTNNFTCIYARGFFRICDEQSGTFWIQDSFCLYTKMGECEIKMSRFGRVSGAFELNKKKKNLCESKYLKTAIRNLSPPQRFNEALWITL